MTRPCIASPRFRTGPGALLCAGGRVLRRLRLPVGVSYMSVTYDPNKQGWTAAAVTTVATLGLLFTAYTIHKNTYRHPRDPMNFQVYHAEDIAKNSAAASHDKAASAAEAKH